jgi:hypothetical protein
MTDLKPGTPATVTPEDAGALQLLLRLLLAEREDVLREKKDRAEALAERDKQRRINAEYNLAEKQQSQTLCTHKKGGKGMKGPKVDYAVSFHTFVDASSYIRCLICGMKWKNTDTDEYLVRRGKQIPNHTGIGWKRAYQMLGESSNTATSSEVKLTASPIRHEAENFDKNPRAVEI